MANKSLKTAWLQGEDEETKEIIIKSVVSSNAALDKLRKICYNRSVELNKTKISDYENSSWSHRQAHLNGMLEILNFIQELIPDKG